MFFIKNIHNSAIITKIKEAIEISRQKAIALILFLLALGAAVAAGYYRGSLRKAESVHFGLSFPAPEGKGKKVVLYYNEQGLLKKLLQPGVVEIGSHRIKNAGSRSYVVRLELVNIPEGVEVTWETNQLAWDEATKTLRRPLKPGERFGMSWIFNIPEELRDKAVIYDGGLRVIDAETGEQLAFLPIKIVNRGEER